jgi:hypothetical protein
MNQIFPFAPRVAALNSPKVLAATPEIDRLSKSLHLSEGQLLAIAREFNSCGCGLSAFGDLDAEGLAGLAERLREIERGVATTSMRSVV